MLKGQMKKNEKLDGLQGQIGEMHNDFEDMKRTREEARKQLEAKFLDIYKKIQSLKEALEAEAKRVNDSLRAFESKFTFLLNELKENVYKTIDEEKKFVREKFDTHEKRMDSLEQMIKEELYLLKNLIVIIFFKNFVTYSKFGLFLKLKEEKMIS